MKRIMNEELRKVMNQIYNAKCLGLKQVSITDGLSLYAICYLEDKGYKLCPPEENSYGFVIKWK